MEVQYLLRLSEELKDKAEDIAKQRGVSLKGLVNIILWDYVENWEKENE